MDRLGLQSWVSPGYGVPGIPNGIIGDGSNTGGSGGNSALSNDAWYMFLKLLAGDLGEDYKLNDSTIAAIKRRISEDDQTKVDLRKQIGCGQSGHTLVKIKNSAFSIEEGDIPTVNMGRWQLRVRETAIWKCGKAVLENGKCCCECSADISADATISKTYTFRAEGYNEANASLPIRFLNGLAIDLQYYDQWYHDSDGPAYFVSESFKFTFPIKFNKCATAK